MAKFQGKRLIPESELSYLETVIENNPDPTDIGGRSTTYEHNLGFRFKKSSDTVQGMVRVYTKSDTPFTAETFLNYLKQYHNAYTSMDSMALSGTFMRGTNTWLYSIEYNYMSSTDCYAFRSDPGSIWTYGDYNCMEYFYDNVITL